MQPSLHVATFQNQFIHLKQLQITSQPTVVRLLRPVLRTNVAKSTNDPKTFSFGFFETDIKRKKPHKANRPKTQIVHFFCFFKMHFNISFQQINIFSKVTNNRNIQKSTNTTKQSQMSNRADLKPQITVFQILTQKTFFVCEPSSGTSPQTTVPYIKHKLLTGTNDPKTFSTKRKRKYRSDKIYSTSYQKTQITHFCFVDNIIGQTDQTSKISYNN